ncbi:high-affinity methionine permease [Botrytis cinerea]
MGCSDLFLTSGQCFPTGYAVVSSPGGANGGDVSFWYGTYCAVGLGIMGVCILYYVFWIYILPYFGKYQIRQELIVMDGESSKAHRLIKVPNAELEAWDIAHDALGRKLIRLHHRKMMVGLRRCWKKSELSEGNWKTLGYRDAVTTWKAMRRECYLLLRLRQLTEP